MSQIYKSSTGSSPPGSLSELTPDSGAAVVPDGSGNINITGVSSTDSNFETFNGGTSTLVIEHRYQGGVTTVGASTQTVLTIATTAASIINISCQLAGIQGNPLGVGGEVRGTVFRGGGGATVLGVPDKVVRSSPALSAATFTIDVSGNDLIVTVTGVVGYTIEWYAIASIVQKTFI